MTIDDTDLTIDLTDEPIHLPEQDKLGLKTIARTLATSIRKMKLSRGVVIGINGSWGIGKTSLINLVEHYVKEDEKSKKEGVENIKVEIVHFHCWWFNNEEALILNFLKTLLSSLDEEQPKDTKLKKAAKKLFLKAAKSFAQAPAATRVGRVAQFFLVATMKSYFNDKESVYSLAQDVSAELKKNDKKRYLVVIDDIDRLSATEMTMMFSLVKTLGHLPNVVYFLAFDRVAAEQALSKVYPGKDKTPDKTPTPDETLNPDEHQNLRADQNPNKDPNFLEKIIQSFINIPVPNEKLLGEMVMNEAKRILGDAFQLDTDSEQLNPSRAIRNICYEYIHTPRDFNRYKNALLTTYPAVKGKVYAADYLVMEAWRIFEPELHAHIESKYPLRDMIFFIRATAKAPSDALASFQSDLLQNKIPQARKYSFDDIVSDIFPSDLDNDYMEKNYANKKRIASAEHFKTYFYWSAEAVPSDWAS